MKLWCEENQFCAQQNFCEEKRKQEQVLDLFSNNSGSVFIASKDTSLSYNHDKKLKILHFSFQFFGRFLTKLYDESLKNKNKLCRKIFDVFIRSNFIVRVSLSQSMKACVTFSQKFSSISASINWILGNIVCFSTYSLWWSLNTSDQI